MIPAASRLMMTIVSNAITRLTPRSSFQFVIFMVSISCHGPSGTLGGVGCSRVVTAGLACAIASPARMFRDDRFANDFVIVMNAPVCGSLRDVRRLSATATLGMNVEVVGLTVTATGVPY